jgi:hypothetical protein
MSTRGTIAFGNSPPPAPGPRQVEARDCLDALLEISHGLSDWEVDFVEDCSKWMGDFTDRQIEKILEIYDRACR